MAKDVRDIDEMRKILNPGFFTRLFGRQVDLRDVVFHYKCPVCNKRKRITLAQDQGPGARFFNGDKTRLDAVLGANGRCVRCSINAGELAYKGMDLRRVDPVAPSPCCDDAECDDDDCG